MPPSQSRHSVSRVRPPFHEGTIFVVPLRDGGFAKGVLARVSAGGAILLGYFFGPRLRSIEEARVDAPLRPNDAVLIARVGDLALMRGSWAVLGDMVAWRRDDWPTPPFVRRDVLTGATSKIEYDDEDPERELSARPADAWETGAYFPDGMNGSGAIELRLTKLLQERRAE